MAEALDAGLTAWAEAGKRVMQDRHMKRKYDAMHILSSLLEHGARPEPSFLVDLSRNISLEWLKEAYLGAVTSARNPFIPGMNLSVQLTGAAGQAPEGERRKIESLQSSVDALLLELLERLPQTVRGFDDLLSKILAKNVRYFYFEHKRFGLKWLSGVFEPEGSGANPTRYGPLGMALRERKQMETFCTTPLVVDFLSRTFTQGLPDLRDTGDVLNGEGELLDLVDKGLVLDYETLNGKVFGLKRLQGADASRHNLTLLPGAQFIAAGLVGRPNDYYRVPVMRMVLELVVYLATLAVFSVAVLFHRNGAVTTGELVFVAYIVAAAYAEGREMERDMNAYSQDVWNSVDLTALFILVGGILVRVFDSSSPWGRGLYAISAPLLFSRILFFAQMLRFQGPMIQVIFSMTGQLVQFGLVMVVIMIGFAMSFFALFDDIDTYHGTLLTLFKVMLGDTAFFEIFEEEPYNRYETVATVLLVLYLIVFTIVLLNLLIAVLSTSHTQVQENAEREFKVSKARLIQHYRLVVKKDLLPAPFNLLQLVLSSPFIIIDGCKKREAKAEHEAYSSAKRAIGQVVFRLLLGPVAVAAGALLWVVSAPYSLFAAYEDFSKSARSSAGLARARSFLLWILQLLVWCFFGGPLGLLALWLLGLRSTFRDSVPATSFSADPSFPEDVDVHDILKEAPGKERVGADDLRRFLENPMSDPEVRQDELNRPTTVEHIKLLRNRLQAEIKDHVDKIKGHVDEKIQTLEEKVRGVKAQSEELSINLSRKFEDVTQKLERQLERCDPDVDRYGPEVGSPGEMKDLAPGTNHNPGP
ncbi:unnamed protein product [Sphacelaria rigidula]